MEHCNSSGEASLVVLAAGLGKRFGGGKQLACVGRTGRPLMYFSVMDAWRAGIQNLVLVINAEIRPAIENDFLPLLPEGLKVTLVLQGSADIPGSCVAEPREKPWGTAHALWCARAAIPGHSLVINADDYYGPGSFARLIEHFGASSDWAMVAFPLENTLSEFGAVSRGICSVRDGKLLTIEECHAIRRRDDLIQGELNGERVRLEPDTPVSMNVWGFGADVFDYLERGLIEFFSTHAESERGECYLPERVKQAIKEGAVQVNVYRSHEPWYGITYREDLQRLGGVFEADG